MLLPESLQPWRPWLDWFAPDLALAVGDLLRRLKPLVGPYRHGISGRTSEPQGIDDLRRRGAYERLLLTEWALADAVPEEFLRRAAGGEHLFLAPREGAREAVASTIVLFDVGPLQLGAPRLAHIALWILLGRRAEEAGGRFLWGCLQEPGVLSEGGAPEMLKRLLRARRLDSVAPEMADAWRAWAQDKNLLEGEWWFVGRQPPSNTLATHYVDVVRALNGESLHLMLRDRHRERSLDLPLPEGEHSARLLKGAFAAAANAEAHRKVDDRFSLKQPALVAVGGHRVAVLSLNNRMYMFQVPDGSKKSSKKPRVHLLPAGRGILGAAMCGKQFGAITVDATHLHFWQFHNFGAVPKPARDDFSVTPGLARWTPCAWLKGGGVQHVYAMDPRGNVVFWVNRLQGENSPAPGITHVFHQRVVAMAQVDHGLLVYAYMEDENTLWIGTVAPRLVRVAVHAVPLEHAPKKMFFAGGSRWSSGRGAWAFETQRDEGQARQYWKIYEGKGNTDFSVKTLEVPASWEVCGLVRDAHGPTPVLRLLALNSDRKALMLVSEDKTESVYTAPDRIATVTVSAGCDRVALLTEGRALIVYDVSGRALRMHVSSDGGGPDVTGRRNAE